MNGLSAIKERREEDRNTRDIAIEARTLANSHIQECTARWEKLESTLGEFREDFKKVNWKLALIVGGIMVASKLADVWMAVHPFTNAH